MKAVFDRDELIGGISIVQKAVSSTTTLPILEGMMIETGKSSVKLTGSDLEIGIEYELSADVVENVWRNSEKNA